MKKILSSSLLLIAALTASITANSASTNGGGKAISSLPATAADAADGPAGVQVTWESYPGWERSAVASVLSVGIITPGTEDDTYHMDNFSFAQETGYGATNCYAAISKVAVSSTAPISQDNILAVSTNSVLATATEYYTYNLDGTIELKGNTTYYIVFFSSNTPNDEGNYTPVTQRVSLNLGYGTYVPGVIDGGGSSHDNWTPGFRATLITESVYNVTYTCKSAKDERVITTGTFENVVGAVAAPAIENYVFVYAQDEDGQTIDDLSAYMITKNTSLTFYYAPFANVTYTCKSELDDSKIGNGTIENVYGTITAPTLDNYAFVYAQDAEGEDIDDLSTYSITEDTELTFYYKPAPTTNTFLRIKGNTSGSYLAAGKTNQRYSMSDAQDATTIFYYSDDKLLNYSSGYYNAMTSGQIPDGWDWVVGAENAAPVKFEDGHTNGGFAIKSNNAAYFYDAGTYADRGGSASGERYCKWAYEYVSSLPVEIGEYGWATFAAPVATEIPDEVNAYTAKVNGDKLDLTPLTDVIPANTAVLLEGEQGSYNFNITTGGNEVDNDLEDNIGAKNVDSYSVYVLANGSNGLGFYLLKADEGSETAVMSGFKAYLPMTGGEPTEAKAFYGFDGDITGIDSMEASAADANIYYDLQGRKVVAPQKGQLYIVNGKKVLY